MLGQMLSCSCCPGNSSSSSYDVLAPGRRGRKTAARSAVLVQLRERERDQCQAPWLQCLRFGCTVPLYSAFCAVQCVQVVWWWSETSPTVPLLLLPLLLLLVPFFTAAAAGSMVHVLQPTLTGGRQEGRQANKADSLNSKPNQRSSGCSGGERAE